LNGVYLDIIRTLLNTEAMAPVLVECLLPRLRDVLGSVQECTAVQKALRLSGDGVDEKLEDLNLKTSMRPGIS
jgi:hypothetical protein